MQKFSYEDVAGMIDHALLHPTLTEKELFKGCQLADCYETATVCVKPSDVKQAAQLLNGSKTKICTVIGFPHGVNLTEIKVLETQRACEDGASEVDMVLNTGKAISGDWKYIEDDILAVCEKTHSSNAKLKVIFENDFLAKGGAGLDGNDLKKKLCQICENAGADWVKTSTGFGYAHQADGSFSSLGATEEDVKLMVNACQNGTQVKAAGAVRDLSTLLRMREIGATRIGTSSTQSILNECRESLGLPYLSQAAEASSATY
jgi:deoxyribose-phosphate aldolase